MTSPIATRSRLQSISTYYLRKHAAFAELLIPSATVCKMLKVVTTAVMRAMLKCLYTYDDKINYSTPIKRCKFGCNGYCGFCNLLSETSGSMYRDSNNVLLCAQCIHNPLVINIEFYPFVRIYTHTHNYLSFLIKISLIVLYFPIL
jgi:hypothetical protein